MSSRDRRPYLTATSITQQFLDFCQDNLDNDLRFVVEIMAPEAFANRTTVAIPVASPATITGANHGLVDLQPVRFETTGTLPAPLAPATTYYVRDVTAHTFRVSTLPAGAAIATTTPGSGVHQVHETQPVIRISNRNMFVGPRFYEARTKLPVVGKTAGEWLSPQVEFSTLDLSINNSDGKFNPILPGGAAHAGMIGRRVLVKVGLRDVAASYVTVFDGTVTPEGGIKRELGRVRIIARDKFDKLNAQFPNTVLTKDAHPMLSDDKVGTPLAVIYGDYTVDIRDGGNVPTVVVNAEDPDVNGETSNTENVQVVIAGHDLAFLDDTLVYLLRGDDIFLIDPSDVVVSGTGFTDGGPANARLEIIQDSGATQVGDPAENYLFEPSDEFLVQVKGKDLGAYSDNPVWQAMDMLQTYGGAVAGDFDATWATYRDKAAPAQSAISLIPSRAHVNKQQSVLEYALSLLEQVRLETGMSRDLMLKIIPNHLEDWVPAPSHRVRQWDLSKGTIKPEADERNNFNRVQALYDYDPRLGEEAKGTKWQKNQAAIDQTGQTISKIIFFPNLYKEADVVAQTREILRIASAYTELIPVTLTARALLRDLGDFVTMAVKVSGTEYDDVPMMIREIGYDPDGFKIPVKLWSFQMCPFKNPGGWNPGYTGIVGGDSAIITEE